MEQVILIIHLFLALAIIGLVLLQRSEGGGLGIGGGGLGGLASPKGTANALTRATALCAAGFFCTSLILGVMAGSHSQARNSILGVMENLPETKTEAPLTPGPQGQAPAEEPAPEKPRAPVSP